MLLGTAVVAAMSISGTGFASARIVGMQQAVSDSGVGRSREDGEIKRMKPRRLDTCEACMVNEEDQDALDRDNREIFCEPSCENGNATLGGLWCNYLGKDGCRACTFNCDDTTGEGCVLCEGDPPTPVPTSTPVEGATRAPVEAGASIPPDAIDKESCTAARCLERATDDDLSYFEENDLTLFCDNKCFDTSSDPRGGLLCNMRGLGQPCRACADNCDDRGDDGCVACDEVQTPVPSITTPAPSQPPETLAPSDMVPTPVPSEIAPTGVPIATEAPMVTPTYWLPWLRQKQPRL
ncbi:unnamed protein product [Ascophyllum nodosum]